MLLLMLAGLLVAQLVTVSIALLLPPSRQAAFRLVDVASALRGGPLPRTENQALVRTYQNERPRFSGLSSAPLNRHREALARILGVPPDQLEVHLFLTPPFAGEALMPPPPGTFGGRGRPFGEGRPFGPRPGPFGPPPFVDGSFVAALKTSHGWTVVTPASAGILTSWERRLLLWFAAAIAMIAPVGYLFARRLAAPLTEFAQAADRLGRDARAPPVSVHGPAEVKLAARALNNMQVRLQRHLDDRTAMIGAISHDLRTPLARLRFRIERAPAEDRGPMLNDIAQMEAMLASVLTFIRDASEPDQRERVDLRSIVECVMDDAALIHPPAELEPGDPVLVEVDPSAVQRVVANLLDNALKYGGSARVALHRRDEEVIVTIADDGPGIPPEELARVFEPFYRAGPARTLDGHGVGLGLSIARSIARAHGGEVELRPAQPGLVAELRLPVVGG